MELSNEEAYNYCRDSGIKYLYYASTVTTSCSYINQGGLLSKGALHELNLLPNPETVSDVSYDVYLDTFDFHKFFNEQNFHGPVLFKCSIAILMEKNLDISIDTVNLSKLAMKNPFFHKDFGFELQYEHIKMIKLKNLTKPLEFKEHLEEILLDNPRAVHYGKNYYSEAKQKLLNAMEEVNMDFGLLKERKCPPYCICSHRYNSGPNQKNNLRKLFL